MKYTYVPKSPDSAYIADRLWLPKRHVRAGPVKRALEFSVYQGDEGGKRKMVKLSMWEESSHHLLCPREFLPPADYPKYRFPFVDTRPRFARAAFEDLVVPRNEEQARAWAALAAHDNGILQLGCGKGKALAHGQRVLTARGWVPIEEVTTEDSVAGTNGRYHRVLGVFPQGERTLYRVTFTDGTHLDCDAEHLWTLVQRRAKNRPVVTLTTRKLLEKPLRGPAGRLYYLPTIAPVEGPPGTFEVDPYTLGALLGDGHLSKPNVVEFTTADGEMLSLMKLPPYHRFMAVPGRHSGRATTYRISMSRENTQQRSGKRLAHMLERLGLMGHTAHQKFVPQVYKYSSSWDRLALLQGLLDTDGSPTAAGAAEYATVSNRLAEDVMDMVLSLGGTCTRQERVTACNGKKFGSIRLLVKLPKGMPLFRLSRKLHKLPPSRQREPYRAVESIAPIGTGLATCISVSSPDQLFLAERYIPTHNTKLSLKKIAQLGRPTLVVVPDGGMLDQWKKSIHGDARTPPGLRMDGELGIIQGDTFSWEGRPLTLALVTSLALRIRDGRVPEEMFRHFGLIVYDEVHLIGAPMFSLTAAPFYGDRIGLTATVEREDGLDPIYRYHIGEPFYADLTQDLIPDIHFQKTPVELAVEQTKRNGITNIGLLRGLLGRDLVGNTYRYWCIKEALDAGRKVLVLGHSKDQLRLFHAMFPGSGLIISETDYERRLDILRNSQVCFAIARLGSTGVDDDRLDALFWLTPFRSLIALQQSLGRIQRSLPGKKQPYVVVFEDWGVLSLRKLCQRLRGIFKKWRMAFQNHPPRRLPERLPPEVQAAYDRAFARLSEKPDVDNTEPDDAEAEETPLRSCG